MNAHAPVVAAPIQVADTQALLAVIRSASASARLCANDLDAIGTMLKAGWITADDAAAELVDLGLLTAPATVPA
jgi:hypothetical protein